VKTDASLLVSVEDLQSEIQKLRKEVAHLRAEVIRDELTGLRNARSLRERIEEIAENGHAKGLRPVLLFIDVDHFKNVNDSYGHETGGALLRQVGRRLAMVIRDGDTAFRYGGDEFVVLMNSGLESAFAVGERVRKAIEGRSFIVRGESQPIEIRLTISVGVREIHPGDTATQVLREADKALYEAKRRSRNQTMTSCG
jgi:diguanylate cyclase (GGDEF)-like protein